MLVGHRGAADEEHSLRDVMLLSSNGVEDFVGESGKENQMNASGRGKMHS